MTARLYCGPSRLLCAGFADCVLVLAGSSHVLLRACRLMHTAAAARDCGSCLTAAVTATAVVSHVRFLHRNLRHGHNAKTMFQPGRPCNSLSKDSRWATAGCQLILALGAAVEHQQVGQATAVSTLHTWLPTHLLGPQFELHWQWLFVGRQIRAKFAAQRHGARPATALLAVMQFQ